MSLDRRDFLVRTGLTVAAGALASAPVWAREGDDELEAAAPLTWSAVRKQFVVDPGLAHLGGFLLASHPKPVRDAIARHRQGLDRNPVAYLRDRRPALEAAVLRAAASYLGTNPRDIALTDSTTMGLGLLYNGIEVRGDQELLTTEHDFFATHESLRLKAERTGATLRRVRLYDRSAAANADEMVARLMSRVTERTRVVAVTWVHSSTGVKLPIRKLADALASANAGRPESERALLCVDGVHGLGVENVTMPGLGCDFFVAGTHKWLFGPRGTGLVWGRSGAWSSITPTIPSFTYDGSLGSENTPGGYHSFEHRWALAEAFRFHERIGKGRIEGRIHALARSFKRGLASMPHVTLHTPLADDVSAGLVCFSVAGMSPETVVRRLGERKIVATQTPYNPSYARVGPGLLNTPAEVQRAVAAVRSLA